MPCPIIGTRSPPPIEVVDIVTSLCMLHAANIMLIITPKFFKVKYKSILLDICHALS